MRDVLDCIIAGIVVIGTIVLVACLSILPWALVGIIIFEVIKHA